MYSSAKEITDLLQGIYVKKYIFAVWQENKVTGQRFLLSASSRVIYFMIYLIYHYSFQFSHENEKNGGNRS